MCKLSHHYGDTWWNKVLFLSFETHLHDCFWVSIRCPLLLLSVATEEVYSERLVTGERNLKMWVSIKISNCKFICRDRICSLKFTFKCSLEFPGNWGKPKEWFHAKCDSLQKENPLCYCWSLGAWSPHRAWRTTKGDLVFNRHVI